MKRHLLFLLIFLLFLSPFVGCDGDNLSNVPFDAEHRLSRATLDTIAKVDDMLSHIREYHAKIDEQYNRLRSFAATAERSERIGLYKEMADLYAYHQADSAHFYLDKLEQFVDSANAQLRDYINVERAGVLMLTGLYGEASKRLDEVNAATASPDVRIRYFRTRCVLYEWMADLSVIESNREKWKRLAGECRDTLIDVLPDGAERTNFIVSNLLYTAQAEEALRLTLSNLRIAQGRNLSRALINAADAYAMLDDRDKEMECLARAACLDIEHGVNEYVALPRLAKCLFEAGDIRRAYAYMFQSMKDAGYCKARLRSVEVSDIFPIILSARQSRDEKQQRSDMILLWIGVALILSLIVVVAYLYRQMCKLSKTRRELAETIREMQEINQQQVLTDKMKDQCLLLYIHRCRDSIDLLDNCRRALLKMFKSGENNLLVNELRSKELINKESKRFYREFDKAFLSLFPHFVSRLNALLARDSQLSPSAGEMLSTELRTFALIRLGVTDSGQISHFLNCSKATIYNYRSRVRTRALCGSEEFEERVKTL